jgi:GDP-D-mannose 3',5'-epimerase
MQWQGKRVLVAGGAGMLGSNLVARLVSLGADVRVVDNLWRGRLENLTADQQPLIDLDRSFFELDLVNYANCLRATAGMEIVYHLADVVAGINYVFGHQLSLFHTNVVMNSNVLHAAIEAGVRKYVYVGTACSYPAERQNVLNPPPFKEEDAYPASPESSYGWSKLIGEYECELAAAEGLLEVGILRLHNVYGPRCDLSPERSQVIPSLIRKAIRHPQEEFVVWGTGSQRRAFVFVDDAVDSLQAVVEKGLGRGVIQIGPDFSISIREIAESVVAISQKPIQIRYDRDRPEGDVDRCADWSKARAVLGWEPKTDVQDGLRKTYAWCEEYLAAHPVDSGENPS